MHHIVVFASGAGSNAAAIIEYFRNSGGAKVVLIVCNKATAGVLEVATNNHIPFLLVNKETFGETLFLEQLKEYHPSLLVLAGFLWKVPPHVVDAYPNRIINIHPALLPAFGGHNMYGSRVHQAVLASGNTESGITIHYVNNEYDKGDIIVQAHCAVHPTDTADILAGRIHQLEHYFFPRTIEFLLGGA